MEDECGDDETEENSNDTVADIIEICLEAAGNSARELFSRP
jgi:hypothetical protein